MEPQAAAAGDGKRVRLPTGSFTVEQLEAVLNAIPFDVTFVDAEDTVRYFSHGTERIFARTRAILGRKSPKAPMISFGEVKRPENRSMVEALGIEVRTIHPDELEEFDGLALVDVQPTVFGDDPPARVRSVDVVIDHHPERTASTLRDSREKRPRTEASSPSFFW